MLLLYYLKTPDPQIVCPKMAGSGKTGKERKK
jgi:hypothetical protein